MADREGDIEAGTRGAKEDSAGGVVQLTDAQGRLTMKRGIFRRGLLAVGSAALIVLAGSPSLGQPPKTGRVLSLRLREDLLQGFAINESPTISTMWPAMPCFSNLVLFDPAKPTHSADTIIGELAERWAWEENYRKLVLALRGDVTWHDGRPFSATDVKYTLDVLREAPDAPAKLRTNPRHEWYVNVDRVEAVDPRTVVIRLKRPQPSFLLMLASGFTPIYAAHVPAASYRTGCIGTGPFKVKEWRKGEFVEYVKNPSYFVKGRPSIKAAPCSAPGCSRGRTASGGSSRAISARSPATAGPTTRRPRRARSWAPPGSGRRVPSRSRCSRADCRRSPIWRPSWSVS